MALITNNNTVCLTIPFSSTNCASLTYDILCVDKELKSSEVQRETKLDGGNLIVKFQGEDLKKIRVAVNSLLKNLILITKTFQQFQN